MTVNLVDHSFVITEIATVGTPTASSTFNELDSHGSLLGLSRLPEEKNASYRHQLLDVYVHRANSTYRGLVNGITRELGLEFFSPIRITNRPNLSADVFPKIIFIDSLIYIYSDIYTEELEMTIERSRLEYPEYFIGALVDKINTSSVFQAELLDPSFEYRRSDEIINFNSSTSINSQALISNTHNFLGHTNIERGSIVFSDLNTFREEVDSIGEVTSAGKYFLNYQTGKLFSFSYPQDGSRIRYTYREEILQPEASPVIVRAVGSDHFQNLLFNQVTQADGTIIHGTVTPLGVQIINELLSVNSQVWGT